MKQTANIFILLGIIMIAYGIGINVGKQVESEIHAAKVEELNVEYMEIVGLCGKAMHDVIQMTCPEIYDTIIEEYPHLPKVE